MINYKNTYELMQQTELSPWLDKLPHQAKKGFNVTRWGDLPRWKSILDELPNLNPSIIDLNTNNIRVGDLNDCDESTRQTLEKSLRDYNPWRKGPFDMFGIQVETEWRSDLKWDRLKNCIAPLKNRLVLDIGCGSGYHCLRMKGAGAKLTIGIEPMPLYVLQFQAVQKYIKDPSVNVLPIGIDEMPNDLPCFDTVFSMGLMYHRRSPLDHILKLKNLLRDGGELILETLVIDGEEGQVLNPEGRYAKMPNVWFIPTTGTLEVWLRRMGLENIRLIDVTKTTSKEQRVTEWMGIQSLDDFLDPHDSDKTIEGYPAPKRAIFLANKP